MNTKPKISIIVPCYKVEKYLRRSMDSLINQTLDNIEIICINDGSPDNCINILIEYQKKYKEKNIVIIDKKNEGVWKGRFDGINKSTGEYIAFVDSDDYITNDYAEKLYTAAKKKNSDILVCGYYRVDVEDEHIYSTEMTKFTNKHIDMQKNPEDILSINTALWNKLYKSDVLKNLKNIDNPPKILDDMMFLLLAYLNTTTIDFISDPLYYYMIRQDSIMAKINEKQIDETEKAMIKIKEIYMKDEKGKSLLEVIDSMAFLHLGISLMLRLSDSEKFKEILEENEKFLDKNFETWRTTKYLKTSYTNKKNANKKVAFMKKIYEKHEYRAFLKVYKWTLKTFKIDIKW